VDRTKQQIETLKHNLSIMNISKLLAYFARQSRDNDWEAMQLVQNEFEKRIK